MRWRSTSSRSRVTLYSLTAPHRAGLHREVVGAHRDPSAVDLADAGDAPVGRERALGREAGSMWSASRPYSTNVAGIEQGVEPLAHRPLPEAALALDPLGAAHAERALAHAP